MLELLAGFWCDEDAVGVVEIILILVVLISLVLIFKEQLTAIVQNIFKKISSQSNSV
ncbi:MAG: holin, BlyA family protein [Clostridiales bacterium]|nr:holin, BlyA family protein [Clostridiales bacterium]